MTSSGSVPDAATESGDPTRESILGALAAAKKPLTVQGICGEINYITNTPWGVISVLEELEIDGCVVWRRRSGRRTLFTITDLGRAALEAQSRPAIDAAGAAGLLHAVPPTEANPRGIEVQHRGPGEHADCPPNILLTCVVHRADVAFCWVDDADLDADLYNRWICDPCLSELAL